MSKTQFMNIGKIQFVIYEYRNSSRQKKKLQVQQQPLFWQIDFLKSVCFCKVWALLKTNSKQKILSLLIFGFLAQHFLLQSTSEWLLLKVKIGARKTSGETSTEGSSSTRRSACLFRGRLYERIWFTSRLHQNQIIPPLGSVE